MGRELKRVSLDFEWPANKVWQGYQNPHYSKSHDCEACDGSGSSPIARNLKDQWYGNAPFKPEDRGSVPFLPSHPAIRAFAERNVSRAPAFYGAGELAVQREALRLADHFNSAWSHHLNADDVCALLEGERLRELTHTWTQNDGWQPKNHCHVPTPEEVNVWSISGGMGHDSINQWIVVEAECKRLGIKPECPQCNGDGTIWDSPEDEQAAESWVCSEPPSGPGYQIWETVSEGSPISPVFATPEELAQYMAGRQWGADSGSSYETWLKFINGPGWAPSMVVNGGGVNSGVDAAVAIAA
jgi:hypothetical protein